MEEGAFGAHLRAVREEKAKTDRAFTLRRLSARCGVTAAYLSRVERNEVSPPGEDTVIRLADELGEDRDVMLALAGKVSSELQAIILKRPKLFADLIRTLKNSPDKAVLRIVREINDGHW